jgi:hypothetical protein
MSRGSAIIMMAARTVCECSSGVGGEVGRRAEQRHERAHASRIAHCVLVEHIVEREVGQRSARVRRRLILGPSAKQRHQRRNGSSLAHGIAVLRVAARKVAQRRSRVRRHLRGWIRLQ